MARKQTAKEKKEYQELVAERINAQKDSQIATILVNNFRYTFKSTILIFANLTCLLDNIKYIYSFSKRSVHSYICINL